MSEWWQHLRGDPMNWLLDYDNPSVRYFTLTDVVERPRESPAVIEARAAIQSSRTVQRIFAKQNPEGWWQSPDQIYRPKYKATVWQLMILAELGVSGQDERIARACEFIFERGMTAEGDFSHRPDKSRTIPYCLPGNVVCFLLSFGYGDDPRTRLAVERLAQTSLEQGWRCRHYHHQACLWGCLRTLRAFAAIPLEGRTNDIEEVIERGANLFLEQDFAALGPEWHRYGFPLFYQCDLLFGLQVMAELGYAKHPGLEPALALVLAKQDGDGRWILERTFNGRMQTNIERKGLPSKWVTLNALRVTKSAYD
ncbi:MAG: nitrogen fixation protein NifH [Anaerolineae bacterium]